MFSKGGRKTVLVLFSLIVMIGLGSSTVLIDSQDWTDVYSGMYQTYENWDRGEPYFVKNPSASNILSGNIFPVGNVTIVESTDNAFNGNMEAKLESLPGDFVIHETIGVDSGNIELIPEDQDDFIVVPESYPEAAVVATPLARITDSWVLIVDEDNLDQVSSILDDSDGQVILMGSYTRELENELSQYSDEEILTPNAHNLSIRVAERFEQERKFDRVILSPGNSLSKTSFEEEIPVLITYDRAPSSQVESYVKRNDNIKEVLLESPQFSVVGNSLDEKIDRDLVVMVKFGQARGDRSSIYAPSLFPLPGDNIDLVIDSATYNPDSKEVLVTYRNPTEVKMYQLSSFNVMSGEESIGGGSDESPVLVPPEDSLTVAYGVNISPSEITEDTQLEFSTSYGSNPDSLEKVLTNQGDFSQPYRMNLSIENITDKSNLTLKEVVYLKDLERFRVKVENVGNQEAFATVSLRDVSVRGQDRSFASATTRIPEGEIEKIYIAANPALDRIDIEQNDDIDTKLSYGKSEDLRLKETSREVEFRTAGSIPIVGSFSSSATALGALLIIILLLVVAEVRYRKISELMGKRNED